MSKQDKIEVTGKVIEAVGGDKFRVEIESGDKTVVVLAYMAGKMRKFYIKIVPGDIVKVELSPYDLTQGRITFREK